MPHGPAVEVVMRKRHLEIFLVPNRGATEQQVRERLADLGKVLEVKKAYHQEMVTMHLADKCERTIQS
jgi:hypothetical protein